MDAQFSKLSIHPTDMQWPSKDSDEALEAWAVEALDAQVLEGRVNSTKAETEGLLEG